ncbi:MAG: hypothetical protein AAF433_05270 [Bacteroidota bacterium]
MPYRLLFSFLVLCGFSSGLLAQIPLAIGEWQSLLSYQYGRQVTQSPTEVIYSTGNAVYFLDKEELSIRRLTRSEGLSETNVRRLSYHPPTEALIIVYENSVIDLYYPNGTFETLNQIDNFNASGGDKRINHLHFGPGNLVYLSAGFGVTAIDLDDLTFQFTTFTGIAVLATAQLGDDLFAATEEGIYQVSLNSANVADFGNWILLGEESGLPADYSSTAVAVYQDELYLGVNQDVWRWNNGNASIHYDAPQTGWRIQYLTPGRSFLLAGYAFIEEMGFDRQLALLTENGVTRAFTANCVGQTNAAIEDEQGRIWFGDDDSGIRYLPDPMASECPRLAYSGPHRDIVYRMAHDGQSLWVAAGALDVRLSPDPGNTQGVYRFSDGQWTTYDLRTRDEFLGRDGVAGFTGAVDSPDDVTNVVGVRRNPVTNEVWVSSYFEGALSYDLSADAFTLYDEINSSLQIADGEREGRVRVGNAAFDAAGNTYFGNPLAEDRLPISVRTPEGEWAALGGGCSLNEAFDILVDRAGFVWQIHGFVSGPGVSVLDPAGTPLDPSDDRCRTISTANSDIPTNEAYSLAVDLDGDVWIGTSQGIVIFECGSSVFDIDLCNGRRPVVSDDEGNNAFLLETELIQCITVDGANQKWIGTTGGAYLLSPDGEEQLAFFDEDNSPLLDNNVKAIAVDPTNGTVFFGTEDGIIAYRGSATEAEGIHAEELVVFPNPVEPGYDGPIAITGLARDARVKITDISGTLVYEDNAAGGQFTWDGADYNGRKVQSGVYLIFSATNGRFRLDNPDSAVGKLVIVR